MKNKVSDLKLVLPISLFPQSTTISTIAQPSISATAASALVARLVSGLGRAQEVAVDILRNLAIDEINHAILVPSLSW